MTSHETVIYEKLFLLEGKTFKNAGHVSTQVKALLKRLKLSSEVARRAAIVTDGTLVKKPASFVTEELNEAITSSYFSKLIFPQNTGHTEKLGYNKKPGGVYEYRGKKEVRQGVQG